MLDAGNIHEFDKPYNLLKSKKNLLYKLVAQTGGAEAQKLFEMARRAYFSKQDRSTEKKNGEKQANSDHDTEQNSPSSIVIPSINVIPEAENGFDTTAV